MGILTLATKCYEHSPSPNLKRALVENTLAENPEENRDNENHKNVHKLQLKNKLEYYRPHENRSLVFYRLKCSEGEVASRSGGIQRRSPQPPLFHKECVYEDLKSSQHRLKQKSSKKKAWISFAHELTGASNSSLEIVL